MSHSTVFKVGSREVELHRMCLTEQHDSVYQTTPDKT